VTHFKSKGWWVCSVDINANDEADSNVLVNPDDTWTAQEAFVCKNVAEKLSDAKVEAIINMAGMYLVVIY
jgi:dihydropteridine reductase